MRFIKMISALFIVFNCFSMAITAGTEQIDENIRYQQERMDYLRNEFYTDYTPCDESEFASFDIEKAIASGVKYNEVQFLATHNSYQIEATEEYKKLYQIFSDITFGILRAETADFTMDSITEQFELGIRGIELDIETVEENGQASFIVAHNPLYDNTSSCYDFETAIEEIKMWSDNNPSHLPLTIIIEPKKDVIEINNLKSFKFEYAKMIDEILREKMGDTLLTPAEMMGDYESLKEMRENDGWLPLEKTMGRVIFLLHDTTVTSKYINQDKSIKTQAMFPMLRYADRNKSYASFIIDNHPDQAIAHEGETIDRCNLIVRTRADFYPDFSEKRYAYADECAAQIISTDFPIRKGESRYHEYSFDGYTAKLQK